MEGSPPVKPFIQQTRHRSSSEGNILVPPGTKRGSSGKPPVFAEVEKIAQETFNQISEDKSNNNAQSSIQINETKKSNRNSILISPDDDSYQNLRSSISANETGKPKRNSILPSSEKIDKSDRITSPNNSPLAERRHNRLSRTVSQQESLFVKANITGNHRPLSASAHLPFELTLLKEEISVLNGFQKACALLLLSSDKPIKELKKSLKAFKKIKPERLKMILKYVLNSLPTSQFLTVSQQILMLFSRRKKELFDLVHLYIKILTAEHEQHKKRLCDSRQILMIEDHFPRVQLTKFLKAHGTQEDVDIVKWMEKFHSKYLSKGPKQYLQQLLNQFPSKQWDSSLERILALYEQDPNNPSNLDEVLEFTDEIYKYLNQKYFNTTNKNSFINSFYFEEVLHSAFACSLNADLDLLKDDLNHDKVTLALLQKIISLHKNDTTAFSEDEIRLRIQEALQNEIKCYFKQSDPNQNVDFEKFIHNLIGNWLRTEQAFQIAKNSLRNIVETLPHVFRREGCKSPSLIAFLKDLKQATQLVDIDPYQAYSKFLMIYNTSSSDEVKALMQDALGGPQAIPKLKHIFNRELQSFLTLFSKITFYSPQALATSLRISWPSISTESLQKICLPKIERTLMVHGLINFEKLFIDGKEFDVRSYESKGHTTNNNRTYVDNLFEALISEVGRLWWLESIENIPDMCFSYRKIGKEMLDNNVNPEEPTKTLPYTQRLQVAVPPFFIFQASSMEMWAIGEMKIREDIPELFPLTIAKTFFTKLNKDISMTLEWSFNEQKEQVLVCLKRQFQFEMDIKQDPWKKTFGSYDLKLNFIFSKKGQLLDQALTMSALSFEPDAPEEHRQTILLALAKHMK